MDIKSARKPSFKAPHSGSRRILAPFAVAIFRIALAGIMAGSAFLVPQKAFMTELKIFIIIAPGSVPTVFWGSHCNLIIVYANIKQLVGCKKLSIENLRLHFGKQLLSGSLRRASKRMFPFWKTLRSVIGLPDALYASERVKKRTKGLFYKISVKFCGRYAKIEFK